MTTMARTRTRFFRVFHDRKHNFQCAVLLRADGYDVRIWQAAEPLHPVLMRSFEAKSYSDDMKAAREAAVEYAQNLSR